MTSSTGMLKDVGAKLRMQALPWEFKELLAKHMAYGAFDKKPKAYPLHNWRKGGDPALLIAAAERHILAYQKGEKVEPDTCIRHLVAAAANLLMLAAKEEFP